MTSMHKRWSQRVTLPVGKKWGTVNGGVAACMAWDSGPRPPPTPLVRVRTSSRNQTPVSWRNHPTPRETQVMLDPRLEDIPSSRMTGRLEVGPPVDYRSTAIPTDSLKDTYCREAQTRLRPGSVQSRLANRPPTPVTTQRSTTGARTPYLETEVEEVLKDHHFHDYAVNKNDAITERLTYPLAAKPPPAPKPRAKSACPRHSRKVEYKENYGPEPRNLEITRPSSAHQYSYERPHYKSVTFKPGPGSTIGYGGYDETPRTYYDDDIIDERDLYDNPYYYSTGKGSHFRMWRDANQVETPDLKKYIKQPFQRSNSYDNLWKMRKFTDKAQSKVVTRWEDEPPRMRTHTDVDKRPGSQTGKVNLQLDCPDDSDMVVNVRVNTSRGSASPIKTGSQTHARALRQPARTSIAWY